MCCPIGSWTRHAAVFTKEVPGLLGDLNDCPPGAQLDVSLPSPPLSELVSFGLREDCGAEVALLWGLYACFALWYKHIAETWGGHLIYEGECTSGS